MPSQVSMVSSARRWREWSERTTPAACVVWGGGMSWSHRAALYGQRANRRRGLETSYTCSLTGAQAFPCIERPVVLGALLAELAERIDVRVLVWAGAPVPAFHPTRREVATSVERLVRRTRIRCEPDPREHPFHCHHEKTVVVDDEVAFVGGIDLTDFGGDRFDVNDHPARRRRHALSAQPQPSSGLKEKETKTRWRRLRRRFHSINRAVSAPNVEAQSQPTHFGLEPKHRLAGDPAVLMGMPRIVHAWGRVT
jgi:phospholipase D-like protein